MKKIRNITIFINDEFFIYRGSKCHKYIFSRRRLSKIQNALMSMDKKYIIEESNFVPSWDFSYVIR